MNQQSNQNFPSCLPLNQVISISSSNRQMFPAEGSDKPTEGQRPSHQTAGFDLHTGGGKKNNLQMRADVAQRLLYA